MTNTYKRPAGPEYRAALIVLSTDLNAEHDLQILGRRTGFQRAFHPIPIRNGNGAQSSAAGLIENLRQRQIGIRIIRNNVIIPFHFGLCHPFLMFCSHCILFPALLCKDPVKSHFPFRFPLFHRDL